MNTDLVIRFWRPTDRATIVAFESALQEHEHKADPSKLPAAEMSEAYVADLEREMAAKEGALFVAEREGRPIGFVCCWLDTDDDISIREVYRRFGYVADIFVLAGERGHRVAQQLYQAAEDHCAGRGMKRMRIGAIAANPTAIASHERFGFQPLYLVFDKPIEPRL